MENENIVDTAEVETVTEQTRAAIDKYWDDDPDDVAWGDEAEAADEQEEAEAEETEDSGEDNAEAEEAEAKEEETKPEAEPEKKDEAGHQRFKLKVNGEEREVDLEEMTALAQKGSDYDGLKTDRDTLRTENGKLKEYEAFLKELAENGKVSIDEVMESTRVELLMRQAEKDGKELTEEEARKQVKAAHKKQEPKEEPAHEKTAEGRAQEAVQAFVKRYPNVKSEDIPQSVWDDANRTGDLIGAYQEYRLQKMSEEITQLKQNNKNKERSTGSRKTAGASSAKSKVDEAWEAALKEDW
jgi:hypothetical protein